MLHKECAQRNKSREHSRSVSGSNGGTEGEILTPLTGSRRDPSPVIHVG